MNAAETIQAAIDKLTRLRDDATQEPWSVESMPETNESRVVREFDLGQRYQEVVPGRMHAEDANLIVTLHATIDAQLALLGSAVALDPGGYVVELARAIIGGQVDA